MAAELADVLGTTSQRFTVTSTILMHVSEASALERTPQQEKHPRARILILGSSTVTFTGTSQEMGVRRPQTTTVLSNGLRCALGLPPFARDKNFGHRTPLNRLDSSHYVRSGCKSFEPHLIFQTEPASI